MINFVIKCDHTIIDDFKYEVFKEDLLIYEAYVDIYSPIVNFVKGEGVYSSKIRIFDRKNTQVLKIYKHVKNIVSDTLFTIKSNTGTIVVREGKNFRVPDLYFRTSFGKITLWGEVKTQSYNLFIKDKEIGRINGKLLRSQKVYNLSIDEQYSDEHLLFLASVFIVDSMYHDY